MILARHNWLAYICGDAWSNFIWTRSAAAGTIDSQVLETSRDEESGEYRRTSLQSALHLSPSTISLPIFFIRSFDLNKPDAEVDRLKGGAASDSVLTSDCLVGQVLDAAGKLSRELEILSIRMQDKKPTIASKLAENKVLLFTADQYRLMDEP
ncbi:hypothetical protein DFH29DRAFT_878262 [Suillus ampliporus]|nr:hypothetical protein DFH29DRAFT_878262 [Suillus ampliporus]